MQVLTGVAAQVAPITTEMIESLRTSETAQILQVVVVLLAIAVVVGMPVASYFGLRMLAQMSKQTDKYDGLKESVDEGNRLGAVSAASLQRLTEQNEVRHSQAQTTDERVLKIMENQTVGLSALTAAIQALDGRTITMLETGERTRTTVVELKNEVETRGFAMNDRLTPIETRLGELESKMDEALRLLHHLADAQTAPTKIEAEVTITPPPAEAEDDAANS